ncbi:MAG: hypothetical protein JNL36_06615 [Candidatus Kapabacteria bacterium]|nr:hypothetical protein [Candidatus Kapabacteria bacterium]
MNTTQIQIPLQWGENHYTLQPKTITLSLRNEVLPLLQDYSNTSTDADMLALMTEHPSFATLMKTIHGTSDSQISQQALTELLAENPTLFRMLKNPPLPMLHNEQRIRRAIDLLRSTIDTSQFPQELYEAVYSSYEHTFWQTFPLERLEQYLEFFRRRFLPS